MSLFKKFILFTIVFLIIGAGAGYYFIITSFPRVGKAPDIKITANPEILKRGEYLFKSVAACADCHSTRDYSKFAGPLIEGTLGKGGFEYSEDYGLPGKFYSKNITPANLGDWTDGEIFRAITEGVSKNGEPLFPLMPFLNYGKMDPNDIYAIIAYMRTLKTIPNNVPASSPKFPMSLIMRTIPQKHELKSFVNKSNSEYGQYLVNAAGCNDCHTPQVKGDFLKDKYLAGGQEFVLPGNIIVRPSNITSDPETGIGAWTKEQFIKKFKSFAAPEYNPFSVQEGEFNTFMPWTFFANMTEEDLGAIYDFLRTVPPVKNKVERFSKK